MKNVKSFALGAVSSVLALTLVGTALAATGTLTITVDPNVKIQVNGQTFQPKDAQGNSVPVFVYNGTTYAPLRALAESYGLEVGYDEKSNMATVGETTPAKTPDKPAADYSTWTAEEEKAYQEFKGMWTVEKQPYTMGLQQGYNAIYIGELSRDRLLSLLHSFDKATVGGFTIRMLSEYGNKVEKAGLSYFLKDELGTPRQLFYQCVDGNAIIREEWLTN